MCGVVGIVSKEDAAPAAEAPKEEATPKGDKDSKSS